MKRATIVPMASCRYVRAPLGMKTIAGAMRNVAALSSVAMIEPQTAGQGSLRPPRKKSRIVFWRPASKAPRTVVSAR